MNKTIIKVETSETMMQDWLNKSEDLFSHTKAIFIILDGRFDSEVDIIWSKSKRSAVETSAEYKKYWFGLRV